MPLDTGIASAYSLLSQVENHITRKEPGKALRSMIWFSLAQMAIQAPGDVPFKIRLTTPIDRELKQFHQLRDSPWSIAREPVLRAVNILDSLPWDKEPKVFAWWLVPTFPWDEFSGDTFPDMVLTIKFRPDPLAGYIAWIRQLRLLRNSVPSVSQPGLFVPLIDDGLAKELVSRFRRWANENKGKLKQFGFILTTREILGDIDAELRKLLDAGDDEAERVEAIDFLLLKEIPRLIKEFEAAGVVPSNFDFLLESLPDPDDIARTIGDMAGSALAEIANVTGAALGSGVGAFFENVGILPILIGIGAIAALSS